MKRMQPAGQPRAAAGTYRKMLFALASLAPLALVAPQASAQDFPARPIRLIVPYTPGAGADTTARIVAERLSASLGQPVVVENRGGAAGAIGTNAGAKAAPDGYTWTWATDPPFTINPNLRKLSFDPQKDFTPVSLIAKVPLVMVANPEVPANNIREFVALAKGKPAHSMVVSNSGSGTSGHLAAAYFESTVGIEVLHVPYKGQAEALTDVVAGRAHANFGAIGNVLQLVKAGKLKILGIASEQRFQGLPDVPTIAESGYPGFEVSAFHGIVMPAGTPEPIVRKVNAEISRVLGIPEVAKRLATLGFLPVGGAPEALSTLVKTDSERWAKVIQSAGIKPD